ncbi:peptidase M23 [Leptospira weilii]|uniref:peptidase M23 n=1 Tax=Leptospira weilii TaxID=28184 RepID=UPI001EF22DA9|nr:peptidase M23 [Leptospira weilii]ULH30657.1 peptidase M23 [Leptospira weilii]UPY79980.1 peptidase M23 [Leptospira weilii]
MSGGQKPHEAVKSEVQSRVTGAIAEATGLPASLVGALVGGANMKQAMKAYEKSVTTEAISQATGIPAWYLNQKISEKEATHAMSTSFSYNMGRSLATMVTAPIQIAAKAAVAALEYTPQGRMIQAASPGIVSQVKEASDNVNKQANKFADHIGQEAYKNRETIDTVVTVAAVVGAAFSFGTSMAALAAYKVAQGATQGGVYGALAGAVSTAGTAASVFTAGAIGFDCSYSYADGFGASLGGGYKLMEGLGVGATLSYNEQSGFGASAGLQAGTSRLNINAGLSYSERDGVSGNVGLNYGLGKDPKAGLSLGVSYNRQDGMGASVGLTSRGGVLRDTGANITRSEYSGFGADISSREYGPGKFSGGLSYNQRDGFTASLNVAGTNALNYNSQTGLSSNTDFISQYSMNRGMSEDSTQTDTEAESRAAQERNNQESGAAAVSAAGEVLLGGRRNEGDGSHGVIGFGDDGPTPAHGAPSSHDPGQTLASSGSFDPDGKPTGGRQLSAADVAEFKADWRKESPAQTDASIAGLKAAGYDTSGLEKFVNDYRNAKAANNSQVSIQTTHPTQSTGFFTNAYNAVVSGASNLWDRVTGGSKPVTHSTSGNVDAIHNPNIVHTVDYGGSNSTVQGAPNATDDPVKIQIVSGDFGRDTSQWTNMTDFRDKAHYNGRDTLSKVDLNGKHSGNNLSWHGPNANFRVDGVFVGEIRSGSRIQISVLDSNNNAVGQLNLKHFNQINQAIYDGKGKIFSAGTYLGRTNEKVGLSDGAHLHVEVTPELVKKGEKEGVKYTRSDIYKWMRGEN